MNIDRDWRMLVGGEFTTSDDGEVLSVVDPATGEPFAEAPAATATDVDRAVTAADEAFEEWRWTAPEERGNLLSTVGDRIESHHSDLVELETRENGKPLYQAAIDVSKASSCFHFFGGAADKFYGDVVRESPTKSYRKVFEPYGTVGVIIPWNWPPLHTGQFTAAALAAGNAVVLKPAPETPLSSLRLAEIMADVLPDGLVNVVSGGTETGVALTEHAGVDKLAFTGHDATGAKVMETAAGSITPVMLELGGKNPELVFPDANIEKAVSGALPNAFFNSGQACSNTERLLVHDDVYDEFVDEFLEAFESLVVGDGRDEETQIGPMTTERQREKVCEMLDRATSDDATVLARHEPPADPELGGGFWVSPTVLGDVTPEMYVAREEVFGPVLSIMRFADEMEAVEIANATEYGLTAAVWTENLSRANRLVNRLEAGTVAVNNRTAGAHGLPFGGYKRSGVGRKGDFPETMREFTQAKSVHFDLSEDEFSL